MSRRFRHSQEAFILPCGNVDKNYSSQAGGILARWPVSLVNELAPRTPTLRGAAFANTYSWAERSGDTFKKKMSAITSAIIRTVDRESDPRVLLAGYWALTWSVDVRKPTSLRTARLLSAAQRHWQETPHEMLQRQCAWLIWRLPILDRRAVDFEFESTVPDFLRSQLEDSDNWMSQDRRRAALTVGYYLRAPWTDARFARRLMAAIGDWFLVSPCLAQPGVTVATRLTSAVEVAVTG